MLVLSRRVGEAIVIDGRITVEVLGVIGRVIRIGITAPEGANIELLEIAMLRWPAPVIEVEGVKS